MDATVHSILITGAGSGIGAELATAFGGGGEGVGIAPGDDGRVEPVALVVVGDGTALVGAPQPRLQRPA